MNIEILDNAAAVARRAAETIAAEARAAVTARGRFAVAFSGGRTPWVMLSALSTLDDVPWPNIQVFQVDERVAPAEHADRNLTHLRASLAEANLVPAQIHAMAVESADLQEAAARYAETLAGIAGSPPTLDLVHLGLGADGHTASLVPGDPILDVTAADVGLTGIYQGRRRMTLTYPIINRARRILWVVTGADKGAMLIRLRQGDSSIPAGRVRQDRAMIIADRAASGC